MFTTAHTPNVYPAERTGERMDRVPAVDGDRSGRILVVDDDLETRRMVALRLRRAGYEVTSVASGAEALDDLRRYGAPQLVILDRTLADMDCHTLSARFQSTGAIPLIVLVSTAAAARLTSPDQECVYPHPHARVIKPFVFSELRATMNTLWATRANADGRGEEVVVTPQLRVNFAHNYLILDDESVSLTPIETRLLYLLYVNRGRSVAPEVLLSKAWGEGGEGSPGSLWVHVRRLRNKLERNPDRPRYLITVRGQGYMLQSDPARTAH